MVISVKPIATRAPFRLSGKSILIVEDQPMIALDAEIMLQSLGAAKNEVVAAAADALKSIAASPPDLAILDIKLDAGTSISVAEELEKRHIPFIFATGYADSDFIPESMRTIPVVRKPYTADALRESLERATGAAVAKKPREACLK